MIGQSGLGNAKVEKEQEEKEVKEEEKVEKEVEKEEEEEEEVEREKEEEEKKVTKVVEEESHSQTGGRAILASCPLPHTVHHV